MCKELFERLSKINIEGKIEKKQGFNYLSWAWAISEISKICDYKYEIKYFDGKPYLYDENLGYMVFTSITIDDVTKEMWLPVLNENNRPMFKEEYQYTTKYGTKKVDKCTMFDINKALMRCLVKNLAVFGLGISLYIGDDLISQNEENSANIENKKEIKYVNEEEAKWLKEHNLEDYLKNKKGLKLEECPFDLFVVLKDKYTTKYGGENQANQVNGGN